MLLGFSQPCPGFGVFLIRVDGCLKRNLRKLPLVDEPQPTSGGEEPPGGCPIVARLRESSLESLYCGTKLWVKPGGTEQFGGGAVQIGECQKQAQAIMRIGVVRIRGDIALQSLGSPGKFTLGLIDFRQAGVELGGWIRQSSRPLPDLSGTRGIVCQVNDITPRDPALGRECVPRQCLLIGGIRFFVRSGVIIVVTRKLIEIPPPGDTLGCIVIMLRRLSMGSCCGCRPQLRIAR